MYVLKRPKEHMANIPGVGWGGVGGGVPDLNIRD